MKSTSIALGVALRPEFVNRGHCGSREISSPSHMDFTEAGAAAIASYNSAVTRANRSNAWCASITGWVLVEDSCSKLRLADEPPDSRMASHKLLRS